MLEIAQIHGGPVQFTVQINYEKHVWKECMWRYVRSCLSFVRWVTKIVLFRLCLMVNEINVMTQAF